MRIDPVGNRHAGEQPPALPDRQCRRGSGCGRWMSAPSEPASAKYCVFADMARGFEREPTIQQHGRERLALRVRQGVRHRCGVLDVRQAVGLRRGRAELAGGGRGAGPGAMRGEAAAQLSGHGDCTSIWSMIRDKRPADGNRMADLRGFVQMVRRVEECGARDSGRASGSSRKSAPWSRKSAPDRRPARRR